MSHEKSSVSWLRNAAVETVERVLAKWSIFRRAEIANEIVAALPFDVVATPATAIEVTEELVESLAEDIRLASNLTGKSGIAALARALVSKGWICLR